MRHEIQPQVTQPHHVWPSLTDDEWIHVEVQLKDLILADYGALDLASLLQIRESDRREEVKGGSDTMKSTVKFEGRPHTTWEFPTWWFSKGNRLISGKPRSVKYHNLARLNGTFNPVWGQIKE